MEERLKQRLVGAAVLASVAVVIVPIALDEPRDVNEDVSSTSVSEIPERPQDRFETTVTTALELPQTPRLDAEVERERERQASGASAGDRRVESDAPARVSIATPSEAPAAPRVVVSGASGTEGADGGREESEAPAAPRVAVSGASGSSASAPAARRSRTGSGAAERFVRQRAGDGGARGSGQVDGSARELPEGGECERVARASPSQGIPRIRRDQPLGAGRDVPRARRAHARSRQGERLRSEAEARDEARGHRGALSRRLTGVTSAGPRTDPGIRER